MIIDKIPFQIDFPIKILNNKKIDFKNKREREKLFRRHIYYYKYERIKNPVLERRNETFFTLAEELSKFLKKKYPLLDILNISVFGKEVKTFLAHFEVCWFERPGTVSDSCKNTGMFKSLAA